MYENVSEVCYSVCEGKIIIRRYKSPILVLGFPLAATFPPLFVEYLFLICKSNIQNHFTSLSPITCLLSPLCPCCLFYNIHCHWTILSPHSLSLFYALTSLAPLGLAFSVPSWGISVFLPLFSEHPSSFTSIWPESWVLLTLSVHLCRLHRLPHCRLHCYGLNH